MRLDKFLAQQGVGSRAEVKQLIKKGCITVNGRSCRLADMKIDENADVVQYNGVPLSYQEFYYYMLNKPAGVVSATSDNVNDTVLSLLKGVNTKNLFPVGRLDKDTEGLLLLTNDGQLAHDLLSPNRHVKKTYFTVIDGKISEKEMKALESGIDIGDETITRPAGLQVLNPDTAKRYLHPSFNVEKAEACYILLTITEGRFHQVKRMFQAVGRNVLYLKRIAMGSLSLDPGLKSGAFRELSADEIKNLKKV